MSHKENCNLSSKAITMFCTFLLLLLSSSPIVQGQSEIKIFREKVHPDDDILLKKNTDQCRKTSDGYSPKCDTFNGTSLGGCWCQCGRSNKNKTFFEPSNKCVTVATARQQSGMVIICQ